ncbi:MAG TPA: DUF167 domain-containing protein [Gemmatimonadales bacterium]|nr:DUF167 domain-containing protein [Gemmatimonadales bacterium]
MTITATARGVRILVQVQPGTSKCEVTGLHGDRIRIRIDSPPVDGRANEALQRFLADLLGVAIRQVNVVAGHGSRRKVVEVAGIDVTTAEALLGG